LHLPLRYEDRTHIYTINQLYPALFATIEGTIIQTIIEIKRRRMLLCRVNDKTGMIKLRFLNFHNG